MVDILETVQAQPSGPGHSRRGAKHTSESAMDTSESAMG